MSLTMRLEYLADGSLDCPLIRLYDFDAAAATRLRRLVTSLSDGSVGRVVLDERQKITLVDGCKLALVAGASDHGVVRMAASNQFECVLTPASWANVAELIEPFCKPGAPNGFQWLDETSDISLLLSPDGLW
jgi:hypothetical protein